MACRSASRSRAASSPSRFCCAYRAVARSSFSSRSARLCFSCCFTAGWVVVAGVGARGLAGFLHVALNQFLHPELDGLLVLLLPCEHGLSLGKSLLQVLVARMERIPLVLVLLELLLLRSVFKGSRGHSGQQTTSRTAKRITRTCTVPAAQSIPCPYRRQPRWTLLSYCRAKVVSKKRFDARCIRSLCGGDTSSTHPNSISRVSSSWSTDGVAVLEPI